MTDKTPLDSPNRYSAGHWLNDGNVEVQAKPDTVSFTELDILNASIISNTARIDNLAGHAIAVEHLVWMLFAELKTRNPVYAQSLIDRIGKAIHEGTVSEAVEGTAKSSPSAEAVGDAYIRALRLFVEGL